MEKFCLKWNDFQVNVSKSFSALRKEQDLHDVTLVSDDNEVFSAHKVVLSASSDFFKSILRKADHAKPMIYLNGIMSKELGQILEERLVFNSFGQVTNEFRISNINTQSKGLIVIIMSDDCLFNSQNINVYW